MDKGGRGGGQPMWIIFSFYNIIIKSANVDKGGEGKTLIHKMWIKRRVFFIEPFPNLQPIYPTFSFGISQSNHVLANLPTSVSEGLKNRGASRFFQNLVPRFLTF